jgi:deazaflavin-dependent oxidoreductase (nitroreductase family)
MAGVRTVVGHWAALGLRRTLGRAVSNDAPADRVAEVAPGVFCLGPWGLTQTNAYLVESGSTWVLVDAGWASDGPRIDRAVRSVLGANARPAAILLTHCHPDHAGAAAQLAVSWGCQVWMHPAERPIAAGDFAAMQTWAGPLDRWVVLPLLRAVGPRRREELLARSSLGDLARTLRPGTGVTGLPEWDAVPTPGHTPGHMSYLRRRDGVLLTGDALVTVQVNSVSGLLLGRRGLSGPPWYTTWNAAAAAASIATIAELRPAVIAPGHGRPLIDAATSLSQWMETWAGRRPATRPAAHGPVHGSSDSRVITRTTDRRRAPWTPPPWLNRLMTGMLRTPVLQRWVGRGTALLTFTGRRTGTTYTTPVSYARDGRHVVIVSHMTRTWWRNLTDRPQVRLRLAGRDHTGTARVVRGDDPAAVDLLRTYMEHQRMTARAQRVSRADDGQFRADDLRRVLADSVVITVSLEPS